MVLEDSSHSIDISLVAPVVQRLCNFLFKPHFLVNHTITFVGPFCLILCTNLRPKQNFYFDYLIRWVDLYSILFLSFGSPKTQKFNVSTFAPERYLRYTSWHLRRQKPTNTRNKPNRQTIKQMKDHPLFNNWNLYNSNSTETLDGDLSLHFVRQTITSLPNWFQKDKPFS